ARWLDTDAGRWLSVDPVWDFPENFGNGWGYPLLPTVLVDPLGTFVGKPAAAGMHASLVTKVVTGGMSALRYTKGVVKFISTAGLTAYTANLVLYGLLPLVSAPLVGVYGYIAYQHFANDRAALEVLGAVVEADAEVRRTIDQSRSTARPFECVEYAEQLAEKLIKLTHEYPNLEVMTIYYFGWERIANNKIWIHPAVQKLYGISDPAVADTGLHVGIMWRVRSTINTPWIVTDNFFMAMPRKGWENAYEVARREVDGLPRVPYTLYRAVRQNPDMGVIRVVSPQSFIYRNHEGPDREAKLRMKGSIYDNAY
ncbi:MAG: hypothetical protein JJU11_18365, partial [Candidatus Sumerlaeia bacterium]|nr:hypothetical protein [Candidatus Sumerlaeia bacterium]